jgi:DNA-binding MarR family transcriptional regulator
MSSQVLSTQEAGAIEAWVRLLRGHSALRRTLDARLQADHRLTVSDFECLLLLSRADDKMMRRVDLADGLQLTASGVTRLLDGLEKHGLVDKATCATDARVTYAVLTDEGHKRLKKASSSHVAAIKAVFEERYTRKELETLARLLARLPGAAGGDESCTV